MSNDASLGPAHYHHHSQQSAPIVNGMDHGQLSADTADAVKPLGFNPSPYRTSTAFTNRPRQPSAAAQYLESSFPTAADVFGTQQQQQRLADYELVKPPPQGYPTQSFPNSNGSALLQSHHLNLSKSQQQIHSQPQPPQTSLTQQTQPPQASQAQQTMLNAAAAQYIAALQNQAQAQTAQQSSNGSQAQFQQVYNALNPSINAQLANLNLGALPTQQAASAARENGQSSSAQEEISTIFVVGFPDDMQEREFQNMFTFCAGFEAATLKIPNKELTAYGPAATGSAPNMSAAAALRTAGFLPNYPGQASPAGVYAGATDPYNLVTVNSGGVVLDSRDLPAGAATTTASWPPNNGMASDDNYARQVLAAAAASNPTDLAGLANLPLAPRKQIIGFAKFKTRQEALEARDVLQGRRVDVEKGAVLKAEMAKKNLHTKRGVGPLGLPLASLVGAGGVPPETLAGLANISGLSSIVSQSNTGGSGETLTQRERELGTLGAMGLSQRGRDREREREEEDRRKREQGAFDERSGRLRQNTGAAYDAFHSVPVGRTGANALPAINVPNVPGPSNALMSPDSIGSQSSFYINGGGESSFSGSASLGGTVHNTSAYNSPDPFSQPVGSSPSGWPNSVGSQKSFIDSQLPNGITNHLLSINSHSTQVTPTGPPRPSSSLRSSPPDSASLMSGHSSNHAGDNLSNHSPPESGMLSIHSNHPSRPMSHRSMSPPESQLQVPHSQGNQILHAAHSHQSLMAAAQLQAQAHPPLQFQQLQQLHQAQQQQQGHFQQTQHSFSLQAPYGQQGNYSSASSMSGSNSSIDDLARTVSNLNLGTHHNMASPPMASPPPSSNVPRGNAADQNPPINTLYVGNLPTSPPSTHPPNYLEDALRALFSRCPGYRKLCFRQKSNGPMCFVEFDDVSYATRSLNDLYGNTLNGFVKGGIRLSFSKNPLGVRGNAHQQQGTGINHLTNHLNNNGGNGSGGMMGIHEGFHTLRQQSMPVDIGHGRMRQDHGLDGPHSNFIATSPPSRFFSPPPASTFNNNLATIKPSSLYSRASASHAFNHTSNTSAFAPFGNGHGLSMNQQFLGDMQYDHRDHLPMVIPPSPNPELTRAG